MAPLFLPTLVLLPANSLRSLPVELREQLDAFIYAPIDPVELDITIAILLKARQFSYELLQQSQKLETATKSKSRLIAMIAHEFRNPLSMISALTQLIQRSKGNLSVARQKDFTERIQAAVKQLTKLTDGLLAFNRVAASQGTFNPKKIDLENYCREIVADFELINQGMYNIHFQVEGDCSSTWGDIELVSTILNNLLSNALKYSPDDSSVSLIWRYH